MNRSNRHHNIYGVSFTRPLTVEVGVRGRDRATESGYALVALLAVMTVLALFALAVAPNIQQQVEREKEKEAIFRGEQVADAIRSFYLYRRATIGTPGEAALPTSMDQLVEGIPIPGGSKKRQIIRASAVRDPLSSSGEWALVRPRSKRLLDFEKDVMLYCGNVIPNSRDSQIAELQGFMVPQLANVLNVNTDDDDSVADDFTDDSTGPFIGVVSRDKKHSVLYYYGIDQHNQWIFTPLFR